MDLAIKTIRKFSGIFGMLCEDEPFDLVSFKNHVSSLAFNDVLIAIAMLISELLIIL